MDPIVNSRCILHSNKRAAYSKRKALNNDYTLTVTYQSDEELDDIVYDILAGAERIADYLNGIILHFPLRIAPTLSMSISTPPGPPKVGGRNFRWKR